MLNFFIFVFLFGLITGSFLNCVIYRLQKDESFLFGRSYCPYCKKTLSWRDLIPVLSFLILRGRCRYCHKKISWQYPLVELFTAILFVSVFYFIFQNQILTIYSILNLCFLFIFSCFLIVIFVYDFKCFLIPDKIIYPAIFLSFLYNLLDIRYLIFNVFPVTLCAFLFFLIIFLISRGKWMGFGDVKLVIFLGLLLGFPGILVALFLAFFIGAIIGIGLMIFEKKNLKSEVPFAPFLIIGTLIALFFGNFIFHWYISFVMH